MLLMDSLVVSLVIPRPAARPVSAPDTDQGSYFPLVAALLLCLCRRLAALVIVKVNFQLLAPIKLVCV